MSPTITPNKAVTINPAAESSRLRNAFDDMQSKAPWEHRAISELRAFQQLASKFGNQAYALSLLMRTELYCPYDDYLLWGGFFGNIYGQFRSYETLFGEIIAERLAAQKED